MHRSSRSSPGLFIAENVDGMSQNFGGSYLKRVVFGLAAIGYVSKHQVIDAAASGSPAAGVCSSWVPNGPASDVPLAEPDAPLRLAQRRVPPRRAGPADC